MKFGKIYQSVNGILSAGEEQLIYSKDITALDSYTKLLIHGDSIGDATGKTVTAVGTAAVTTAQYKFAEVGRSIVFDGDSDYLTLADSDDWNFGSGDWTIDFWVRFNTLGTNAFFQQRTDNNNFIFCFRAPDAGGTVFFRIYAGGAWVVSLMIGYTGFVVNTWYHIAVVHHTTSIYEIFVNGTSIGSVNDVDNPTDYTGNFEIGRITNEVGASNYHDGWLSEFRISKGIARWTSNFTPPTAPYDGARTIINISGLNGNTDVEYRLICRIVNGYNGGANCLLRCNNDTGANYGRQEVNGNNATAGATRSTNHTGIYFANCDALGNVSQGEIKLYAKSGYIRTAILNRSCAIATTTVSIIQLAGYSWNNTADNITSLVVLADQTNGLGVGTSIELYARRGNS
jgi:hypothetical protein